MSANAATRLMHAVLDGEATPAEARRRRAEWFGTETDA